MQCGLCAVVAGLFRRAMCIAGSRRGSGESGCYQELPLHQQLQLQQRQSQQPSALAAEAEEELVQRRTSEIALDHGAEENALKQRISDDGSGSLGKRSRSEVDDDEDDDDDELGRLDELERSLLARLDVGHYRPKHTGRFLTMHKRRRKRLVTRSLDQDPALLDDVSHGQVQCVLQRVTNWKFNAFTLETAAGGRSVPVLCVHLFHWYGLLQHFNLDVVRVWKLFTLIEEGYHSTNPYHNSIHAADVTQAMHCFLQETQIRRHLSYLEIMASLIAAVTHDLDHPGVNQPFLVATSNHLAALYENTSVLENHHWRSAVGCLLESGVSEQLPDRVKPELQRHISSLILATDITRQQEFLTRLKRYLDERELDMRQPEHRHFVLQIALKCADISNPCRPWDISRKWSYKVCEEFFRQGDYERQLNLPVTAVCDRRATSIPKIQAGFFNFVVLPLYEEWHRFLDDAFSRSLMRHLRSNQRRWEALIREEEEEEEEAAAAAAAAAAVQETTVTTEFVIDAVEASENTEEDSGSLELTIPSPGLMAPPLGYEQRDARRHSVPLGVCRGGLLPHHQAARPTAARRESLPGPGANASASLPPILVGCCSRVSSRGSSLHQCSEQSPCPTATASSISPGAAPERPVSAENLLPDTSIASIANSLEASRLSSLLQQQQQQQPPPWEQQLLDQQPPSRQSTLTRQQTFPPIQPYARMRYMSTTVEMSQCCTEVLLEADSSSSRSGSPAPPGRDRLVADAPSPVATLVTSSSAGGELRRHSTPAQAKTRPANGATGRRFTTIPLTEGSHQQEQQLGVGQRVFFIGSPPDSPPRLPSHTPSSDSGSGSVAGEPRRSVDSVSLPGNKRDYGDSAREKSSKMLKLMKENVDPRTGDEVGKEGQVLSNRRSKNQSWARRRGSAPVGLLSRLDDTTAPNRTIEPYSRRGSVPADITAHPNGGVNRISSSIRAEKLSSNRRRSSLPHEAALVNLTRNPSQLTVNRENYPLNNNNNNNNHNNNNNNNNNTGSNNNGSYRLTIEGAMTTTAMAAAILSSRRGSVPADISELRRDLLGRNSLNSSTGGGGGGGGGKSRGARNNKKLLRRRSSGGPEMFASGRHGSVDGNDNGGAAWPSGRSKRDLGKRGDNAATESTPVVVKRRGSLPIEMLAVSFPARYIHR